MRNFLKSSAVAFSAISAVLTLGHLAWAYDGDSNRSDDRSGEEWQGPRHRSDGPFMQGICVGQALAQQGLTVPAPQTGQPPVLDATLQAALQSAEQTCLAQLNGGGGSPTPSPVPSTSSSPAPAPTTSPGPTSNPTPTSIPSPIDTPLPNPSGTPPVVTDAPTAPFSPSPIPLSTP